MSRDGEVIQMQHFFHHGDTLCHQKSGYVTTKLHGTSTFSRFLPSSYAGHVNLAGEKFMLNCKYGSPVEIIIFRVQYFFSAFKSTVSNIMIIR